MSSLLGKKVKKTAQAMSSGPQVEAVKPKPSMMNIGQASKRPAGPSSAAASSSAAGLVKKPLLNRIDFSSTATAAKPQQASLAKSAAHLRPPLDETHKPFCEKTEIDYATFETDLEEACKTEKFNKVARMICAALRDVDKKREATGLVAFEENVALAITRAIKQCGASLKNANLSRAIFYLLCTTKGLQSDKQSLLVAWLTHLNEVQPNSDPLVITSFLHDALGERSWVDKPHSLLLVTRILRYFGTRFPTRAMYAASGSDVSTPDYIPDESISPLYFGGDDEEAMRRSALDYLAKSWDFYGDSPPRNLLRTMNAFSAFPEVRLQAARKIDGWLQNAKLQRCALEVLLFLGCNIGDASEHEMDVETLSYLLKLRSYKSKMVSTVFNVMLKELFSQHKANLRVVIHQLLNNELGHQQHRFHLNMGLLHSLFLIDQRNTTQILGAGIANYTMGREETLFKPVRLLVRELVRSCLRTDFLFSNFAAAFMEHIAELARKTSIAEMPAHVARITVDTCTWLPLVAITQQVKDAFANRRANGGSAAPSYMEMINKFQGEMREYHRVVVQCLNALAPLLAAPQMEMDHPRAFYRMLFLDPPETYTSLETGAFDEAAQGLRVVLECPINEKLVCLIAKCDSLAKEERLNLLDTLIRSSIHQRAPNDTSHPLANINTLHVFETVLKMIECREEGVTLESWYWKGWRLCLFLLCGTAPAPPVFAAAHAAFPVIRMLTKMILLGNFAFPLALDGKSAEEVGAEYERVKEEEAALSDESGQRVFCKIDAVRPLPRPLQHDLAATAAAYRMAAELAQLRSPDLLSRLIEEEGSTAAMPAIEAVIRQRADAHAFIPVVCVTQFLIHHLSADAEKRSMDEAMIVQMSVRLRASVAASMASLEGEGAESLLLLLARLASGQRNEREAAVALISYLFHEEMPFPVLPQLFSLDRLSASPIFEKVRSAACSSMADAFRVESDVARMDTYLRFITKHAREEELHEFSVRLSHSSPRHDDSIRASLLHFFARYVEESASAGVIKRTPAAPAPEMKMVHMEVKGRKISIVSSTLFFILELLSRFCGGGEGRARLLGLLLSPRGDLPTVTDEEGETVQLLNDQLRSAMLSSTDESIVKVALGRVDSSTAFNMICTFGLTNFSASNLLKNLDTLTEEAFAAIPNAQSALPYVIGYRRRGAEGGEKFLALLLPPKPEVLKEEPMDEARALVLLPPPRISYTRSERAPELPILSKTELSKKLREMVSTSAFSLTSLEFRSAAASEASTDVCLECLELNLKFFFAHVGAFNDMVQLLTASSEKYPSVKAKLRTLCAKVLKSAAVPASIEDQIKKLAEGPAPAAAAAAPTVPTKKPLDLSCATAEDLLETLHKRKNMTNIERARLINRFVLLRPEIIEVRAAPAEVERQIGRIFGVHSRECLDRVLAQIWLRSSEETIEAVLKSILSAYSASISPSAVMELLQHCACSVHYYKKLDRRQLGVACAYMVEKVTEEFPTRPDYVLSLADFIARLLKFTGPILLQLLASHALQIDRSTATLERRVAAAALVAELAKRFPCLVVSEYSAVVSIDPFRHSGIAAADKDLTRMMSALFACKDDSTVANTIDELTRFLHENRSIVLRQLPVMSRLMARISESPSAKIRESTRYRWIINFLIASMSDLLEDLPAANMVDLDRLIDGLLDFHQRHVSGTRDELDLSRRVLELILAYLRTQRTNAREFLQLAGGDRVSRMIEIVREDETFEEIKRVLQSV